MVDDGFQETLFEALTDDAETPGGLSDDAQAAESGNFLRHAASLGLTKTADGLIDPKLVLSWLLTHLGAPAFFVGLLVPVREAGALLPQLFTAKRIHAMARRKWAWVGGSAVQGGAALAIGLAGLVLSGWVAGAVIVALLAVLAVARSVCSVSYKDVLGKTVGMSRRGTATGLGSTMASAGVIVFALVLMLTGGSRYGLVIGALFLAGGFWLLSAALFSTLSEDASDVDGGQRSLRAALSQMSVLRENAQLRRFIAARGLLVATALAPPYLVLLAAEAGQGAFDRLGVLVLASAAASLVSSYVWGRLADRSSRKVLMLAGLVGALALAAALGVRAAGLGGTLWALPAVLFVLMIAYHGVRQGRSTYLVDMSPKDARAQYTAVANTVIGVLLLAGGLFGAIASALGAEVTIALFAVMSAAAAWVAYGLDEVEGG